MQTDLFAYHIVLLHAPAILTAASKGHTDCCLKLVVLCAAAAAAARVAAASAAALSFRLGSAN